MCSQDAVIGSLDDKGFKWCPVEIRVYLRKLGYKGDHTDPPTVAVMYVRKSRNRIQDGCLNLSLGIRNGVPVCLSPRSLYVSHSVGGLDPIEQKWGC